MDDINELKRNKIILTAFLYSLKYKKAICFFMINFWFVRKDKVIGEVYYGAIGSNFLIEQDRLERNNKKIIHRIGRIGFAGRIHE